MSVFLDTSAFSLLPLGTEYSNALTIIIDVIKDSTSLLFDRTYYVNQFLTLPINPHFIFSCCTVECNCLYRTTVQSECCRRIRTHVKPSSETHQIEFST